MINKNKKVHFNTTHGMSKGTRIYRTWQSMLGRCRNKNYTGYKNYGGRGITVCDRWLKFENFYKDMGDRPEGKTIDRISNNGNYCKKNCRWATPSEQMYNRNFGLKFNGMSTVEASKKLGGKNNKWLVGSRISAGWSKERAFTEKIKKQTYKKKYTYDGKTLTLQEWSKIVGLKKGTIYDRINNYNWSVKDALTLGKKINQYG